MSREHQKGEGGSHHEHQRTTVQATPATSELQRSAHEQLLYGPTYHEPAGSYELVMSTAKVDPQKIFNIVKAAMQALTKFPVRREEVEEAGREQSSTDI